MDVEVREWTAGSLLRDGRVSVSGVCAIGELKVGDEVWTRILDRTYAMIVSKINTASLPAYDIWSAGCNPTDWDTVVTDPREAVENLLEVLNDD